MSGRPKAMVPAEVCGTCAHYCQHYIISSKGKWMPLWYGHCATLRGRHHNPGETCEDWQEREE